MGYRFARRTPPMGVAFILIDLRPLDGLPACWLALKRTPVGFGGSRVRGIESQRGAAGFPWLTGYAGKVASRKKAKYRKSATSVQLPDQETLAKIRAAGEIASGSC